MQGWRMCLPMQEMQKMQLDCWVKRSSGAGNGNPPSILAWKIPWAEEHGRLQSIGSQRVGHFVQRVGHNWVRTYTYNIYIKLEVNAVKKSSLSKMLRISFELSLKGVVDKICEIWASLAAQTVKNLPAMKETWPPSLGREEPLEKGFWSRKWQPTPVFLPGEFQGQRTLAGYRAWGLKEWDSTERLTLLLYFTSWNKFKGMGRG